MAKQALRPVRIEGNIAYVTLSQGREAVIDAADAASVGQFNWHYVVASGIAYAARNEVRDCGTRRPQYMHRFLLGSPQGLQIDHVNGDGLDNRRSNIRAVCATQNQRNKRLGKNNTSGVQGVCYARRDGLWMAYIKVSGKGIVLGHFKTFEAAVAARKQAERELGFHENHGRAA